MALWILVALALVGCSHATPLRVGTSGDYAPFSKDGAGFDVDVARLFAAEQGRPLELVPFKWPELAQSLERGDFDVAMSGVTWRPDRDVHGWMSLAVGQGGPVLDRRRRAGAGRREPRRRARGLRARALPEGRRSWRSTTTASLPGAARRRARSRRSSPTASRSPHFRKPGDTSLCVAESFRKVYWVAPARAEPLGPPLDAFLRAHEPELRGAAREVVRRAAAARRDRRGRATWWRAGSS